MSANTNSVRRMLSSLQQPQQPQQPDYRQKLDQPKAKPAPDSDSESTDSESFATMKKMDVLEKNPKKKVVKKALNRVAAPLTPAPKKKEEKPLPQPAPPAAMVAAPAKLPQGVTTGVVGPAPLTPAPKVRKAKAEKVEVPAPAPAPALVISEKKAKRAPSAYNKFVSEKMKAGLSMKAIGEAWKSEKEKEKK